jgi:hypothetical protein
LTREVERLNLAIVLAREDAKVDVYTLQAMTELFQL